MERETTPRPPAFTAADVDDCRDLAATGFAVIDELQSLTDGHRFLADYITTSSLCETAARHGLTDGEMAKAIGSYQSGRLSSGLNRAVADYVLTVQQKVEERDLL